ncbi:MAG TPA: FkbM family methyltransferase [Chloroflexi bacterium]|nr:FkbM family methyltransferase [Chloroflexota bacterium]
MSLSDISLNLYRKTVKRFRPAHVATHWLMTHGAIPSLEKVKRFQTMPDDPFWFRLELLTGRHEPETTAQLDRLARPGMVMLDVGAHVGYYACRYARKIGENGRIYAFEPHPRTFDRLRRNVNAFANVIPVQAALADAPGTAVLHDYLMMSASGSLHYDEAMVDLQKAGVADGDVAPRLGDQFADQTYTVQTLRADDYLAEQGVKRVDVIKMDIEGAELSALRGLRQTIANSPGIVMVMEYNPAALKAFDHNPEEALGEVLAMGFQKVQVIEPDGNLVDVTGEATAVHDLTAQLIAHMGVVNVLFT